MEVEERVLCEGGWEISLWNSLCRPFSLEMRNLIAHPRGSHWDMNQIKFKGFWKEIDLCVTCM